MTPPTIISDTTPATMTGEPAVPSTPPAVVQEPAPYWRSTAVLVLAALVWLFYWTHPSSKLLPVAGVEMHLPGYVALGTGLIGQNAEISVPERIILPKDTEFARKDYVDYATHTDILLSIVLSGAMQQSIHRPEACLVGQGWQITNEEDIPIRLDSGRVLTVRNLTIKRDAMLPSGQKLTLTRYNMYWFVGENVTTPYHAMRVFLSSWDRIVHNRAHRWAYVTVASLIDEGLVPNGRNAAQTRDMMIEFIKKVVPTFQKNEMTPDS